jgi:hypothetical protein
MTIHGISEVSIESKKPDSSPLIDPSRSKDYTTSYSCLTAAGHKLMTAPAKAIAAAIR